MQILKLATQLSLTTVLFRKFDRQFSFSTITRCDFFRDIRLVVNSANFNSHSETFLSSDSIFGTENDNTLDLFVAKWDCSCLFFSQCDKLRQSSYLFDLQRFIFSTIQILVEKSLKSTQSGRDLTSIDAVLLELG